LFVALAFVLPRPAAAQTAVTTYHNDTLRTGWNSAETTLTTANVGGGRFGLQTTVTLDANEVDAQPLVVSGISVKGSPAGNVVYVATNGDMLYALNATSGAILASRTFGTPVPLSMVPGQCENNGPSIGITSTPVIAGRVLYLIADTLVDGAPAYVLHAVSLTTLQDVLKPVTVSASAPLGDGSTYAFDAAVSRQRPALLLSGTTLYAGFGSFCDFAFGTSRGWLLGWNALTLAPLSQDHLDNTVPLSLGHYFLTSIWMSGFGPAAASAGDFVYAVTGNSGPKNYSPTYDLSNSILQVAPDLSAVAGYWTDPNHFIEDVHDRDLGSGGAMLPPAQPGLTPNLLVAGGKDGTLTLLERTSPGLVELGRYPIGSCWCGPSFFTGADGIGRIVTSGGQALKLFKIATSATTNARLVKESTVAIGTGEDPGFFTSVSSNGLTPGSAVIWAVGRPGEQTRAITLYAIDPVSAKIIYQAPAGSWLNLDSNVNNVPTVANGFVYVGGFGQLAIFGLQSARAGARRAGLATSARESPIAASVRLGPGTHLVYGRIEDVGRTSLTLRRRDGRLLLVDCGAALAAGNVASLEPGDAARAIGSFARDGRLLATSIMRTKVQALSDAIDR
jgi:hypothetical protein